MNFCRIRGIELTNYRQFISQSILINKGNSKNIVIIEGKNGFGKSNIFNAITWCFFGIEQHLKSDEKALPICNTKEFSKLAPEKFLESKVRILLDTDEGAKEVERTIITHKNKDGSHYQDKSVLKIMEQADQNWNYAPYPEIVIQRIVPQGMSHFFFIDGEKLRQLFENIKSRVIKDSIFELSQITLLSYTIDHLTRFKNSLRQTVKGKEPTIDAYQEAMEKLDDRIQEEKIHLAKYKTDREEAIEHKKHINEELLGFGNLNVTTLEERRKRLEAEIGLITDSIKEKQAEYFTYLYKITPCILAEKPINNTLSIIKQMELKHKLPPKIQSTFVTELIEAGACVCGRELNESTPECSSAKRKLEALLKTAEYSDISNELVTLRYQLKEMCVDKEEFEKRDTEYRELIRRIQKSVDEKQEELKDVNLKIKGIPIQKIQALSEEREGLLEAISEYGGKIGKNEENLRHLERTYNDTEYMWKRAIGKKKDFEKITQKTELCDHCIAQLETIKEKIMAEIRVEIESLTRECFSNLITAKNFSEIRILEDYELFIEKDGFNAVTSLSAAETLCLGYSFMAALRKSSGFVVPIVIDTPLAKIDKEYRVNVADWFRKTLSSAQVVLLVTDAEYTDEFKREIKPSVIQEFSLSHNPKTGCSEVTIGN
jgi:DNA sulfur modification protein DndD